jgi:hypothetical protein
MSGTSQETLMPNVERSQPFAIQMGNIAEVMNAFLRSKRKSISLPVEFSPMGVPAFTFTGTTFTAEHMRSYTRAQLLAHLVNAVATGKQYGVADFKNNVPSYASTAKHMVDMLDRTYTVTKGANEGQVRSLFMHAMGAARRALKRADAAQHLSDVVHVGNAWYAEGVVDKDGQPRAYENENKARKAFIRNTCTVYAKDGKTVVKTWYEGLDKAAKNALLATAKVWHQSNTVGMFQSADGSQVNNEVNNYTLESIAQLPAVHVIKLAKKAGAKESVYKGKGAKARCVEWFAEMTSRMASINSL